MSEDIKIRPAEDGDAPAIIELISAVYVEYPDCILDVEGDEPQLLVPASYYTSNGGAFWVAETPAGDIAGSIACLAVPDGLQLYNLYLSDKMRGSGLARQLFAKVLDYAAAQGARSIVLWTDTRFERAHSFYERIGFKKGPMLRSLADRSWSVEYFYRMAL